MEKEFAIQWITP